MSSSCPMPSTCSNSKAGLVKGTRATGRDSQDLRIADEFLVLRFGKTSVWMWCSMLPPTSYAKRGSERTHVVNQTCPLCFGIEPGAREYPSASSPSAMFDLAFDARFPAKQAAPADFFRKQSDSQMLVRTSRQGAQTVSRRRLQWRAQAVTFSLRPQKHVNCTP